jgi:hypothetical protein
MKNFPRIHVLGPAEIKKAKSEIPDAISRMAMDMIRWFPDASLNQLKHEILWYLLECYGYRAPYDEPVPEGEKQGKRGGENGA